MALSYTEIPNFITTQEQRVQTALWEMAIALHWAGYKDYDDPAGPDPEYILKDRILSGALSTSVREVTVMAYNFDATYKSKDYNTSDAEVQTAVNSLQATLITNENQRNPYSP